MVWLVIPHTGECLSVLRSTFPSPGVGDSCFRHQVAFVAAVNENASLKPRAVFHLDSRDSRAFLPDAILFTKPVIKEDFHTCFFDHLPEHLLSDMRLKVPGNIVAIAANLVMRADSLKKLKCITANDSLFP